MYKLISYPITDSVPTWPGNPQLQVKRYAQMAKGDVCNTCMISIFNHTGTHYDGPNHFVSDGLQISQLPLDRFIFEHPLLLDIPKTNYEKICPCDLQPYALKISNCDLLMLRTGFSKYRTKDNDDIKRFEECGPAIASSCSQYLVSNFKNLSAVAVDFVSIGSFSDQEDGNLTHQILLGGKHAGAAGHFICAIEDVNMADINPEKLKRVFCLPIMVLGIDSAPVTIIAEED
ncbi:MAG: cyclase family protein [Termitinemataceae bacterium]|nr:MAG: cyclase family protein [Termitinemataceae bacterium]